MQDCRQRHIPPGVDTEACPEHQAPVGESLERREMPFCFTVLVFLKNKFLLASRGYSVELRQGNRRSLYLRKEPDCWISLFMAAVLTHAFDERLDVFNSPDCCARAKFHGLGIATGTAAFPPSALAYGNQGDDLRKTKKTTRGDFRIRS